MSGTLLFSVHLAAYHALQYFMINWKMYFSLSQVKVQFFLYTPWIQYGVS